MTSRDIHKSALLEREKGNFLNALQLNAEALLQYQKEQDLIGFSEALADQSITLRLLSQQTEFRSYLILAKHTLEAAIEIAKETSKNEALPMPLFNLGKVNVELEDYPAAIIAFQEAIEHQTKNALERHNRPAVLADFKIHLAVAEYKNGDKSAKERLLKALSDLEESNEDKYNKLVWTSGAHLYLADILKEDNLEEAKQHLQKAKQIIDSDERLTLRKSQWQKLAKTFDQ